MHPVPLVLHLQSELLGQLSFLVDEHRPHFFSSLLPHRGGKVALLNTVYIVDRYLHLFLIFCFILFFFICVFLVFVSILFFFFLYFLFILFMYRWIVKLSLLCFSLEFLAIVKASRGIEGDLVPEVALSCVIHKAQLRQIGMVHLPQFDDLIPDHELLDIAENILVVFIHDGQAESLHGKDAIRVLVAQFAHLREFT